MMEIDNVESTLADPDSLTGRIYNGLIKLIRLRQEEPAFDPYAEFAVLDLGGDVFCIRRWAVGATDSVICVVNLMSTTSTITLDASMAGEDMLSGQDFQAGPVQLPVFAVRWIRCRCVK